MSLPLRSGLPSIEVTETSPEPSQLIGRLSNDPESIYRVGLHVKGTRRFVSITRLT